jgi:hypothetical protein
MPEDSSLCSSGKADGPRHRTAATAADWYFPLASLQPPTYAGRADPDPADAFRRVHLRSPLCKTPLSAWIHTS